MILLGGGGTATKGIRTKEINFLYYSIQIIILRNLANIIVIIGCRKNTLAYRSIIVN